MNTEFYKQLKKPAALNLLLQMIPIPISVFSAILTSKVVASAVEGSVRAVLRYALLLLSVIILQRGLSLCIGISFGKRHSQALHKCKIILYKAFLSQPQYVLYAAQTGDILERFNDDFNTVTNKIVSFYPGICVGVLQTLTYFVFLSIHNWQIGLILLAISVFQIIPPIIIKKYMQVNYDNCRDIEADLTDMVIEGFHGFETIQSFGLQKWWFERFAKLHKKYSKVGSSSIYTMNAQHVLNTLTSNLLKYGTYGIIGFFVLKSFIPVESGIQIIALSGGFYSAVNLLFDLIPQFSVAKIATDRINNWFSHEISCLKAPTNTDETLSLSNAFFSYGDKSVIHDLSIFFSPHKVYKITGANGSGKSTLLKLLAGLLTCRSGEINNGKETEGDIPIDYLLYLPQDDYSFSLSPHDFFKMAIPEKFETALEFTKIFGMTDKQIKETLLSDLSGGERKKVYLSFAFALDPVYLLLDEPTNSLDKDGRRLLTEQIKSRKNGTIIVSHSNEMDDAIDYFLTLYEGNITYESI